MKERDLDQDEHVWVDDLRDWTGSKQYDQIRETRKRDLHGTFATHSSGCNNE